MSNGISGESISEAKAARNEWVSGQIALFKRTGEYSYLGNAIHAMSDEYAPSHNWKPWYGQSKWMPSAWDHGAREVNLLGKYSIGFKLSEVMVKYTYESATKTESRSSASSTTPAPVTPRPVDPAINPINPIPWNPTPVPVRPDPVYPPQPPVPLPPLR